MALWGNGLQPSGTIDWFNSTSIPLLANGVFTGTGVEVYRFAQITVFTYSDVDSAVDGLSLELSTDGIHFDRKKVLSITGGISQAHTLAVVTSHFRVVYTNGTSNQTAFRLQTIYHTSKSKHLTSGADEIIPARADVELVRSANDTKLDISRGIITGISTFHRFGRNNAIPAAATEDVWRRGGYYTWLTTPDNLRIQAGGNAADDPASTGAHEITITFLDANWNLQTETLATNGTLASTSTSVTAYRFIRAFVSKVGTYASPPVANTGAIVIETDGGIVQASITANIGQTELSQYTVPKGRTAYLTRINANVSSAKSVQATFFQRQNVLDGSDLIDTTDYKPRRAVVEFGEFEGEREVTFDSYPSFPAYTDLWMECTATAGGADRSIEINYDLILVDNTSGFTP